MYKIIQIFVLSRIFTSENVFYSLRCVQFPLISKMIFIINNFTLFQVTTEYVLNIYS